MMQKRQLSSPTCFVVKTTLLLLAVLSSVSAVAKPISEDNVNQAILEKSSADTIRNSGPVNSTKAVRFTLGGYGEAVMTRNFYSDHIYRYMYPESHKNDESHGRFDLPHVTLNFGAKFPKGWSMGMEIEFEHGGTESAVEMDADESGEYEAEVEKGGEVALEQFWIQKSFGRVFNIRAGEIVVPVGATNNSHMPNEYFTNYRSEGEATLFPCTWHQVGISAFGYVGDWRYEAQFLSGLDSDRFGANSFVHYGATSSYEFKIANTYAVAARLDNYSIPGLRVSVSGYYGRTFKNTLRSIGDRYSDVKGDLYIGAIDFSYNAHNWIVRGNADYAYLSDADRITAFNKNAPLHSAQDGTPSKHQPVAKNAVCVGMEAGYDVFSQIAKLRDSREKLYIFGRYEYYNAMASSSQKTAYEWCAINRMAFGVNYYPLSDLAIKAEYSKRYLKSGFNNEPSLSIGVSWCGFLIR